MERETKRRSPSIIARLMGMEELPPQHLANKQQRDSSDSCKKNTESTRTLRKSTSFEDCSSRKTSKQEFKDVFEVVETKKSSANSTVNEDKIALFRQKVTNAKRFSMDENLQSSKEFSETLDALEADKDLFLKCLQDPNSLYGKHLSELKSQHPQSRCRHVSNSEDQKYGRSNTRFGSDADATSRNDNSSYNKYNIISLPCPHHGGASKARKSSPMRSESKYDKTTIPAKIVVLKPNLEMALSVSKSFSPSRSLHTFPSNGGVLTELPNDGGRIAKLRRKKSVSIGEKISIQKSEESREIARKVTRKLKNSLNTGSSNLSHARFSGYAGDESSCYGSGNDSSTESDVTTLASRQSFYKNERRKNSSSLSSDVSLVKMEAKKRLSEQWKMNRRFEGVGSGGRSSTLGEVLALSDRKEKAEMLDMTFDQTKSRNRYVDTKESADKACPVGISSKEGWKDIRIKHISKSRSLPASSFEGSKASCGIHRADRYLMPNEAINLGRDMAVINNSNPKEGSFTCNLRSSARKAKMGGIEDRDRALDIPFSENRLKISEEEDDATNEKNPILDVLIYNTMDKKLVVDEVSSEHENIALCSEIPGATVTEISDSISVSNDSPPGILDNSFAKETCGPSEEGSVSFCHDVHEPEFLVHSKEADVEPEQPSPASVLETCGPSEEGSVSFCHDVHEPEFLVHSKEADVEPEQPSPASVLENPFLDDVSSECFSSLSAELQGLRMQLQLLKFESEEYADGMIVVSSDEEGEEDSTEKVDDDVHREIFRAEKSSKFSYMDDVLIESGFDNADPDVFMVCPIDHSVFLKLEKKYSVVEPKWLVSERRLLFDRINVGIAEILKQQSANPSPWVNPSERRVSTMRSKDVLRQLLGSQEKKASNENTAEKVMEREVQWLDLEGGVDIIGRDIEKVLMDELVVEFITV